jgi:hypothetical protein
MLAHLLATSSCLISSNLALRGLTSFEIVLWRLQRANFAFLYRFSSFFVSFLLFEQALRLFFPWWDNYSMLLPPINWQALFADNSSPWPPQRVFYRRTLKWRETHKTGPTYDYWSHLSRELDTPTLKKSGFKYKRENKEKGTGSILQWKDDWRHKRSPSSGIPLFDFVLDLQWNYPGVKCPGDRIHYHTLDIAESA